MLWILCSIIGFLKYQFLKIAIITERLYKSIYFHQFYFYQKAYSSRPKSYNKFQFWRLNLSDLSSFFTGIILRTGFGQIRKEMQHARNILHCVQDTWIFKQTFTMSILLTEILQNFLAKKKSKRKRALESLGASLSLQLSIVIFSFPVPWALYLTLFTHFIHHQFPLQLLLFYLPSLPCPSISDITSPVLSARYLYSRSHPWKPPPLLHPSYP